MSEQSITPDQYIDQTADQTADQGTDDGRDDLETLPPARLAAMLRDKRKAEKTVRERLREVEGERDALSGRVSAWQAAKLREYAKDAGVLPEAIEDASGRVTLTDLVAEDGTVDPDKASSAFAGLKESAGYLFTRPGPAPRRAGVEFRGGMGEAPVSSAASWSDIL